ncbi:hypothetical protein [Streptomyces acidiscabies]|uniref:Uncharacterized protein n=1 Tax=Streptomyces acidiscabies TaxID=42234 RepID=A0AAP6BLY2_9ACTN|nr:hypothetical protein [Streptomyces acidiscabies]MBZ3913459.1 hypothetical protein [Streptomyces acidiscabies]MDX2967197.1 hypothetical protein [Streptomyces acidiscabies]MDX3026081.1 hypothetical protein [Streptomyces acidiscabies]MDX3797043.1 hypothetical protein [Streptomyces acidiscabies]GAQ51223.1 hypothetical protein a10_01003 [Streptomyces acidiscabies]
MLLDDEPNPAEVVAAHERIAAVARELDVVLMSESELAEFTAEFESARSASES